MTQPHPYFAYRFCIILILTASLTGCAGMLDPTIPESAPMSPSPSPTATIVWFPPSETPTDQVPVEAAATPERKPGIGDILLMDDFSSPDLWDTVASDQATVAVGGNILSIAVQPGYSIASFRKDITVGDFYAEITASPSLCQGQDEYGFIFRAPNRVGYYRFTLTCDGRARLDRISVSTHEPLQPPMLSGDVPPGAPGQVRLGVWAVGSDLRFFLNDRYQFSVNDRNYFSGGIGVFAHAVAATPVTVVFSNLVLYTVNYSPPLGTPGPKGTPKP